jgi:ABC-type Mn2+/Zn2+ transport system ATPase subunit
VHIHSDLEESVLLRCEGLAVGRAGRHFASGLTWTVRPATWWWIEGDNGSGKTTLLATLLGELPAIAGRLTVHPWIADGSGLGSVLQLDEMLPTLPLSVSDYVGLGLAGSGRCDPGAVAEAVEAVGLEPRKSYWALSGGQRQRARVARALARHPALLVLDEPFNHLDADSTARCLAAIGQRRQAGAAVLCVAHRPPAVPDAGRLRLADGGFIVENP